LVPLLNIIDGIPTNLKSF